jgi:hypothetical protein
LGNRRFQYSETIDEKHFSNFMLLVGQLERSGIPYLLFFPPFADVINQKIDQMTDQYRYIIQLKRRLSQLNISVADYTDAQSLGATDCEFIDGFHGGEVIYARILNDLAGKPSLLKSKIQQEALLHAIHVYQGKAFIPDPTITSSPEIDFLSIGCEK